MNFHEKENIDKKYCIIVSSCFILTIGIIGCGPVVPTPSITATLNIDIADNYTYWVYIDDVLWGTTDWNGDITLYNVPLGFHNIYVQSTAFPYYCIGNADTDINVGINNVYITVICII